MATGTVRSARLKVLSEKLMPFSRTNIVNNTPYTIDERVSLTDLVGNLARRGGRERNRNCPCPSPPLQAVSPALSGFPPRWQDMVEPGCPLPTTLSSSPATNMTFLFVNHNASIDRAARKQIRSQAARGKNGGKTLIRPSRFRKLAPKGRIPPPASPTSTSEDVIDSEDVSPVIPTVQQPIGSGLSIVSFPAQLDPASSNLIQRAFSFISAVRSLPELLNAIKHAPHMTTPWVRLMYSDEAYFHCALALSARTLDNLCTTQVDPAVTWRHLSYTFRLINERLSQNTHVSDSTFAVVIAMTQYERLQAQYQKSFVHVQGLQQMVSLRGGISRVVRSSPAVAQKVLRVDLECALHLGIPTLFDINGLIPATVLFMPDSAQRNSLALDSRVFQKLRSKLRTLLINVKHLSQLLNEAGSGHREKLDGIRFHVTTIVFGHCLIQISALGELYSSSLSRLENGVHLGLAAFLMTILRNLDHQIASNSLLAKLLQSAARGFESDQENQDILLWVLFIGRASVLNTADEEWLLPVAARIMSSLALHSWEDVRQVLSRFPWVWALHDIAGEALFHKITR